MSEPLAYFLTWATYGTRLHGDERGSVDSEHNAYGEPYLPTDQVRRAICARRLKSTPAMLDSKARQIVTKTIQEHCRIRRWELLAVHVRSNHVHVVVENAGVTPERMLSEFKAWATRRLRGGDVSSAAERVWGYHGSTRYLWDAKSVHAAVAYALEGQDVPR